MYVYRHTYICTQMCTQMCMYYKLYTCMFTCNSTMLDARMCMVRHSIYIYMYRDTYMYVYS